jgi:hypothetical protein
MGNGDFLFGAEEGAAGDFVHVVHPSLVVPADVAADHVKVLRIPHAFQGSCGPVVVADPEFVALGEHPVFCEESADVFAGA